KMLVQGSFTETLALFSADGKTLDAYGLRAAAAGLVFYCAVDEGPTELAQSFSHALVSKYARSWAKGFDSPGSHFGEYLVREISDLHAQLFERLQQDEKALLQPEEGVSN
ncbi:MAG: hypothetical protein KGH63_03645, partial [Candidatus Micrarchaeota archaeon]|nr:hypothetical protein [Candidatus Micrarchaeota archaeon]